MQDLLHLIGMQDQPIQTPPPPGGKTEQAFSECMLLLSSVEQCLSNTTLQTS